MKEFLVLALASALLAPVGTSSGSSGMDLWVDGSSASCSDSVTREQAGPGSPWCSVVRAASGAQPGDTVHVKPGRYAGTLRPLSGQSGLPIAFRGEGLGVVIDAANTAAAIKLVSVTDVSFSSMTVTGASSQGIWVDGAQRIAFEDMTVEGNSGHGIQILRSVGVSVSSSAVRKNLSAGIFEGTGTSGGRYVGNSIVSNGLGSDPYNGDGIQMGGRGGYVARNTISGNGTPGPYEHGIYAGPPSSDYLIEDNMIASNAGSNLKAAGSGGVIRYNRIQNGRLGLVFSDNGSPIHVYYNLIFGRYQHAVFLTTGQTAAQAKLWNNTIMVDGKYEPGDGAAVFIKSAAFVELRNNLISATAASKPSAAVNIPDIRRVAGEFVSNNNWFSSPDNRERHLIRDGVRMNLKTWNKASGQDAASVVSAPPAFNEDARVGSQNLGIDRGASLGLSRDYTGKTLTPGAPPDVGAYEH